MPNNCGRRINNNIGNCETSSDSNNEMAAKRARYEENAGEGVQKFKGVVTQQNGHWGAQIYANHQRIWLGTFKSEREAAMAYDSATIKLRSGGDGHRNFPWNDQTVLEPHFQSQYSTEAVLGMIRDGSYPSKFSAFLRTQTQSGCGNEECCLEFEGASDNNSMRVIQGWEQLCRTQLFQKELTPSDVGKLNRLVIPKKHAVTYFPFVCGSNEIMEGVDIEVVFYDKLMRSWKFRYCYWKSSQSYVFTRGWNRFVKDKKLKARDIVAFYVCEPSNWREGGQVFSLIDVIYHHDDDDEDEKKEGGDDEKQAMGGLSEDEDEGQLESKDMNEVHSPRGLRLFGVCIN